MSEQMKEWLELPNLFLKEGTQFINRCTKPDKEEFFRICWAIGIGFLVMGFIGFFVKLIHIPINNVLIPS
ncbi:protein translocase SEC61 complex gamma subunit, archaeal and eukaryotic [Pneumocystis jirovecii RU7]|nr:protein translocase SEC61 complex gamma subunit, archaeal and eukaryotic [Pneumocystis jirovecii RU7]KTW31301.1 protein translocase SEC61 complex gamma subunit, archaeal and eukaryotic [Pneumocystis jirovecii RU7]